MLSWELGKGDLSVRELNRNPVGKLGCLHERGEAGRGSWWGAGGQTQVAQNLEDHCGIFDSREERQCPAALRAGGEVDGEDAFE